MSGDNWNFYLYVNSDVGLEKDARDVMSNYPSYQFVVGVDFDRTWNA